ncbi:MAG TPA: succinate dehydrogenase cytochrome b subunit [Cyclobacteriaceae bacterium]|nr:succinate dehydrogenase cytochrome b subunit [Cyclobacteriaceae bacterium]
MKWIIDLFASTLGRKLLMSLTGIFLILFLVVHLIGNLQLLKADNGEAFNRYAEFMGHNALIQLIAKGNFTFIILHVVVSLILTVRNRRARGPEGYAVSTGKSSIWSSRNMGILGTLVLIFLVIHLKDFWGESKFGSLNMRAYDEGEYADLYFQVAYWFQKGWYVALYVVCMGALAFHLWHGFASAFQTLGLRHQKYTPLINFVGKAFAVVVPALFAWIPIAMYFHL